MTEKSDEIVFVASGSLTKVEIWHEMLLAAGIKFRIAFDKLAGGFEMVYPNTVELWVHRAYAKAAEDTISVLDKDYRRSAVHPIKAHDPLVSNLIHSHSRGAQQSMPSANHFPQRSCGNSA